MLSEYIIDVSEKDFDNKVIAFSENTPVIALFRAEWAGACKQLDPIMNKLIVEAKGVFRLARVNTDRLNSEFKTKYDIKFIPAVRVFYKGQDLGGFQGYKSEDEVRIFLEKVLEYFEKNYPK
ncbi:MAG: hypothetical protein H0S79_05590 [Anaerolineaceae bacterium]|nr:hypothetical protein [Anaerolineaceae bacterium]